MKVLASEKQLNALFFFYHLEVGAMVIDWSIDYSLGLEAEHLHHLTILYLSFVASNLNLGHAGLLVFETQRECVLALKLVLCKYVPRLLFALGPIPTSLSQALDKANGVDKFATPPMLVMMSCSFLQKSCELKWDTLHTIDFL